MPRNPQHVAAVIASGGSLSAGVDIGDWINASIEIETDFTSAGAITFEGSHDGVTFYDVYDDLGNECTIPSHATHTGRAYEVPAAVMNFKFMKVRSGTAASAVTQTPASGGTTIRVVAKA